ncbi:MAG: septal ring lytic transglycosylase RlpA family protein [Gammaproteobacteria bacterium]|nr:septal ring lytic transglycosylase RlpA family protein [Gammaproteobacteria bacterium]
MLLIAACGSVTIERGGPPPRVPAGEPVPRAEPPSKYGNPESYVVFGKRYYTLKSSRGFVEQGIASWYGKKFHGRKTSSGEIYDMYKMTAAHKQLPLPTYVEVRNLANGRRAVLRVNDRGPFHGNRIIDLSYAAALKLGIAEAGTAFVEVRAIDPEHPAAAEPPAPAPVETESAPVAGIFIQVGAFQQRSNAEKLVRSIRPVVPAPVQIREITSRGQILYRVQVGPVASVEDADAAVAGLEELGIVDHHFIVN